MKKFDFFNQYRDPVIVVRDYEKIVFKNNTFCRVFKNFEGIRKFAHQMTFEMCPVDSENVDLFSPIFQAITSKENFFARVSYLNSYNQTFYYDLTAVKRGAYTIMFLVDVSSEVLLRDNQKEQEETEENPVPSALSEESAETADNDSEQEDPDIELEEESIEDLDEGEADEESEDETQEIAAASASPLAISASA